MAAYVDGGPTVDQGPITQDGHIRPHRADGDRGTRGGPHGGQSVQLTCPRIIRGPHDRDLAGTIEQRLGSGQPPAHGPRCAAGVLRDNTESCFGGRSVFGDPRVGRIGEQSLRCGKPTRRRCGIRRVPRTHHETLGVVRRVEEATCAVAEVGEHHVEEDAREGQPFLLSRDGVQREEPLSNIRVVLEDPIGVTR